MSIGNNISISGNTDGLKNSTIKQLENLYTCEIPQGMLWTEELISEMAAITGAINKEIAVYFDSKGKIIDVLVGDYKTVELKEVEGRRNKNRLSGIYMLHTHPGGSGTLSAADTSSMKLLRLNMVAAIGVEQQKPADIYVAVPSYSSVLEARVFGPYKAKTDTETFTHLFQYILEADEWLKNQIENTKDKVERAVLVGIKTRETRDIDGTSESDISMTELNELAKTAGAVVVSQFIQKKDGLDPAYFIGKGKVEELRLLVQSLNADMVIFDEEITPSQQRNIAEITGVKVLDRTGLILDIFAQRAKSREGKIQVELAQLEYNLPRLQGLGTILSRLGGGIGTRGPGETKLETDRRHIRKKITALKQQLNEIKKQRGILRVERQRNRVPVISLVGYTNAGKSLLLNTLCQADVYTEDKLFATLDTTTRQLALKDNETVLATDTVGFIRKLPHNLLEAFKSTLEEVLYSDILIIVADSSDPHVANHINIVDHILSELGAGQKPTIIALNKIDLVPEHERVKLIDDRKIVEISAKTGEGLDQLKACIKTMLNKNFIRVALKIPFAEGWVLPWIYENGKVISIDYDENNSLVEADIKEDMLEYIKKFVKE
jgi:GTP-binding protein HflX